MSSLRHTNPLSPEERLLGSAQESKASAGGPHCPLSSLHADCEPRTRRGHLSPCSERTRSVTRPLRRGRTRRLTPTSSHAHTLHDRDSFAISSAPSDGGAGSLTAPPRSALLCPVSRRPIPSLPAWLTGRPLKRGGANTSLACPVRRLLPARRRQLAREGEGAALRSAVGDWRRMSVEEPIGGENKEWAGVSRAVGMSVIVACGGFGGVGSFHRIRASARLEKTFKIFKSNLYPRTTKPYH